MSTPEADPASTPTSDPAASRAGMSSGMSSGDSGPAVPRDERLSAYDAAERQKAVLLRVVRMGFFALILTFTFLQLLQARDNPATTGLAIMWWLPVLFGLGLFAIVLVIDLFTPRKKLSTIAGVFFGVVAGMVATIALGFLLDLLVESWVADRAAIETLKPLSNWVKILIGLCLCYLGVSTVVQTQDDFRLVIPYVEFSKQLRGTRPLLLDTSSLIDGRIADIAATNFMLVPLIIPRFVLDELQRLSDSQDPAKRLRARRGLDIAARLQRTPRIDITIDESRLPIKSVDQMLIELARATPALIVTSDVALARIAQLQGVTVLNLNDLATALKPSLLPGSSVTVRLIRAGEQPSQGVGYLDDGTMVVAEDGSPRIGQTVPLVVTGALQTSAGRLIFARLAEPAKAPEPARVPEPVETAPLPTPDAARSMQSPSDAASVDRGRPAPSLAAPAQASSAQASPAQAGAAHEVPPKAEVSPAMMSVSTPRDASGAPSINSPTTQPSASDAASPAPRPPIAARPVRPGASVSNRPTSPRNPRR